MLIGRRIRWVGHVAHMKSSACRILVGKLKERDRSEDLGLDWRRILKWIINKWDGRLWVTFICRNAGTGSGLL